MAFRFIAVGSLRTLYEAKQWALTSGLDPAVASGNFGALYDVKIALAGSEFSYPAYGYNPISIDVIGSGAGNCATTGGTTQ